MARELTIVIERDEDGYLVASVPSLPGCHAQARAMDELLERIKEAIQLCLEVQGGEDGTGALELVGIQRVAVWVRPEPPSGFQGISAIMPW